jgi:hypothetical protein
MRAAGSVLAYALRDRLPFDIAGHRIQRYTLKRGQLNPETVEAERGTLKKAIEATLGGWRGRRESPVYQQLPNLKEPDWKTLKVGDINQFWQSLEAWQSRIEVARRKQRPGDILVLAEETPNSVLEFEALRTAGRALVRLNRPRYALAILESARRLDPDDVVTGRRSRLPLPLIAAGVRWAAAAAIERAKDYWSLATRAEFALVENRKEDAIDDPDRRWERMFIPVKESEPAQSS